MHLHVLEGDLDLIENAPEKAILGFGEAKQRMLRLLSPSALNMSSSWVPSGDASLPTIMVGREGMDDSQDSEAPDQTTKRLHPLVAQIASREGTSLATASEFKNSTLKV